MRAYNLCDGSSCKRLFSGRSATHTTGVGEGAGFLISPAYLVDAEKWG